tara:strand:- start:15 stop:1166 length:1152 start_codon:yes stop_codon:yes gene_type:complete
MPTPRPFNAPTTFSESPLGEVNRQVQRMQQAANNPATRQGLSGFTQKILGYGSNAFNAATPVLRNAVIGGGRLLAGRSDGSELPLLAAMATSDTIDAFNPQGVIDRQKRNEAANVMYGQLPADYKRTELLASGQVPGGLPSDYKETEAPYYRSTPAPDGGDSQGTQTSPSPMTMKDVNDLLLAPQGIRKFTPNQEFNSNQLPTTNSSPYDFSSEDAQVMGMSKEDSQLIESGGKVETVFKDGVQSDGQIFKDPGSRAFLDYDGTSSMLAFRAAERARGMITLQGKTYIPNPLAGQDGKSDFELITQDQRDDINSGRITAQDLASTYINRINGANADFSDQDYQTMGGNKANVPTMSNAGSVEVDIDADFDYENPIEKRSSLFF